MRPPAAPGRCRTTTMRLAGLLRNVPELQRTPQVGPVIQPTPIELQDTRDNGPSRQDCGSSDYRDITTSWPRRRYDLTMKLTRLLTGMQNRMAWIIAIASCVLPGLRHPTAAAEYAIRGQSSRNRPVRSTGGLREVVIQHSPRAKCSSSANRERRCRRLCSPAGGLL